MITRNGGLKIQFWAPALHSTGGIQTYLRDFLASLSENSRAGSVTVLSKNDTALHAARGLTFGNVPRFLRTGAFVAGALLQTLRERPDVIICAHINFSPAALLIKRLWRVPYWVIGYGVELQNRENTVAGRAVRSAQGTVAISSYAETLLYKLGCPTEACSVLPCTVDADRFSIGPKPESLLNKHGLRSDQPVILTVARMDRNERYKGIDRILRALVPLREILAGVHYIIAGEGDDRPHLEALARELGVDERVTFLGAVSDERLPDYYRLCDVFAMPSSGEGFGIVFLEALASGKPVLAGSTDGARDALLEGKLGELVDADDLQQLTEAFGRLLSERRRGAEEARARRRAVIENFGAKAFEERIDALLGKLEQR